MAIQFLLVELGLACAALVAVPYVTYFRFVKSHAGRYPARSSMPHVVKVSMIVCTLNAAQHVESKFHDILRQTYPLAHLEVIVVDGGSTDGTAEILEKIRDRLSGTLCVRIIEDSTLVGKASQINRGFEAAEGDVVVTSDADVRMDEGAIQTLVESVLVRGVGAACARQVLANPKESWVVDTEGTYRGFYEILRIGESNIHSTPIFHGGLSAYRREAAAPIAEDVNADDTQLALGAVRKGFRAIYEPRSVYYTDSPLGFLDALRQRVRRAQGLQRVFWRNYDMLNPQKSGPFFLIFLGEFYFHLISPPLFWVSAVCLTLFATFLSSGLVIGFLVVVAFLGLILWRNKRFPARFLASLVFYMLALMLAMALHLIGHDFARWSKKQATR